MQDDEANEVRPDAMTRRDALKRGAVVGGAVLWAAPVVQALSVSEAAAAQPSGVGHGRPEAPGRGRHHRRS